MHVASVTATYVHTVLIMTGNILASFLMQRVSAASMLVMLVDLARIVGFFLDWFHNYVHQYFGALAGCV